LGTGIIVATNSGSDLKYKVEIPKELELQDRDILPRVPESFQKLPHGRTLIESSALIPLLPPWETYLFEIRTYDFDPALLKSSTPIYAVGQLTESGSNLAVVLRSIFSRPETKAKWLQLMHTALPFIDRFEVRVSTDRRLLIGVKEKYGPKFDFPASLVSDGTLNIAALVTALYFQNSKHPLTLLEEPERNIHPSLISTLVEMAREASKEKQIVVTTHNPEMVRHTSLDELILVSRDDKGFSTITRPKDNDAVKGFLLHEVGLEDVYVQNLLES